jgi:hypothetical protein
VPNFNGNWLQLLLVFGFFGFSILTWVVRQLKEKSIARHQQQMREQQRIESLRTGRAPSEPSASTVRTAVASPARPPARTPEQRLAEIAARRAAQRQAGATTNPSTRTASTGTGRSVGAQRSTPMPRPRPTPRPAGGQVPNTPKTTAQRRQEMIEARRRALEARTPPTTRTPRPAPAAPAPPKTREPKKKPRTARAVHEPVQVPKAKRALTRKQLRRAIILKEIIDPPIALRPESDL